MAGVICHGSAPEVVVEDVRIIDSVFGDVAVQLNGTDIVVDEVTVDGVHVSRPAYKQR